MLITADCTNLHFFQFVGNHKNVVVVEGDSRNKKTISCVSVNIDGSHHQSQEFVKWFYKSYSAP